MVSISNMRSLLSLRLFSKPSPPLLLLNSISPALLRSNKSVRLGMSRVPELSSPAVRSLCNGHVGGYDRPIETKACSGEIHIIVGPMFAGKTTALLRRVQSEMSNGRTVAMVKSSKDTRYALDSVVTHDGTRMSCFSLSELSILRDQLGPDAYDKVDVIGIDEAQFFGDLYDFCCNAADREGKIVIVAGLDGDYMRNKFGSVLDIIPIADSVTKLNARCEMCGRRAYFTLRKTKETETELIGGADKYMPVCRQHYTDGQIVIRTATRIVLDVDLEQSAAAAAAIHA